MIVRKLPKIIKEVGFDFHWSNKKVGSHFADPVAGYVLKTPDGFVFKT